MAESNIKLRVDAGDAVNALQRTNRASSQLNQTLGTTNKRTASATANIQRFGISFRSVIGPMVALTGAVTLASQSLKTFASREADLKVLSAQLARIGTDGTNQLDSLKAAADRLGDATLFSQDDFIESFNVLSSFRAIAVSSFAEVSEVAADIAQVMGTDVKSAAVQLAKALEDPERGLTALSRSGITFNETQTETIKKLVDSGKLLDAQSLILETIKGQYEGAATAAGTGFAGAQDLLAENTADLTEALGKGLEPAAAAVTTKLAELASLLSKIPEDAGQAALALGGVALAIKSINAVIVVLKASMVALPWVALAAGVAAGVYWLNKQVEAVKALNAVLKEGAGNTNALKDAVGLMQGRVAEAETKLNNLKNSAFKSSVAINKQAVAVEKLREQLKLVEGNYKIRLDLETRGFTFDEAGNAKTYTVNGITYDAKNGRAINPPQTVTQQIESKLKPTTPKGSGGSGAKGIQDISVAMEELQLKALQADLSGNKFAQSKIQAQIEYQRILESELPTRKRSVELEGVRTSQILRNASLFKENFAAAAKTNKQFTDNAVESIKAGFAAAKNIDTEMQEQAKKMNKLYGSIGKTISTGIVDSLTAAVDGTKSLADVASDTLKNLANIMLKFGINSLLGSLGGGDPSNIFTKLFGGKRANGGSVMSSSSYLVGERGPELFSPGRSGSIAPNGSMGGANVVVNVDASGTKAEGDGQGAKQLGSAIGAAVQAELIKQQRPGGLLSR